MIAIAVLVVACLMIPLLLRATKRRQRAPFRGIDWKRGADPVAAELSEGARLLEKGDAKGALAALDRALASKPDDVDALAARASAHHRLGHLDEALADYDRALELGGPRADTLNDRGCLHRDRGDLARAIADIDESLRLAPEDATAHVSRAEVLAQKGDLEAAMDSLRRAIAIDATWRDHARTAEPFAELRAKFEADPAFTSGGAASS